MRVLAGTLVWGSEWPRGSHIVELGGAEFGTMPPIACRGRERASVAHRDSACRPFFFLLLRPRSGPLRPRSDPLVKPAGSSFRPPLKDYPSLSNSLKN